MSIRIMLLVLGLSATLCAAQLQVVCTVPDLADLVRQIGGERVAVTALARSGDNPHFVSARPSYIRKVASADAFVLVGLDLEVGWAPALLRSARNRAVQPGRPGFIDCSAAIEPMEVASGTIDRSQGDVHPHGNPHYLLAPHQGIVVVRFLAERLAALDPGHAEHYRSRAGRLARELAVALYGEACVEAHALDQLLRWHLAGTLAEQVSPELIGGWYGALAALRGAAFVDDHNQWPYLAQCFGLRIVAHLEPKAGVPPTSSHLQELVAVVAEQEVTAIITAPWFDPRHATTLAEATGTPIVPLAHQVGSRPQTGSYKELCAANVAALASLITAEDAGE